MLPRALLPAHGSHPAVLLAPVQAHARKHGATCASAVAVAQHVAANPPMSASAQWQPITSAYVHLPFCKKKCHYCDFPVEAVGSRLGTQRAQQRMERYVGMVCAEIAATRRQGYRPLQTIYFGGGTPSLVPPHLIARILAALDQRYGIAASAEIALEADPGTFDAARLREYQALGVSRISMGVQAFQQELLEVCGRSHSVEDVRHAIDAVHASGIPSWNLDLISGLPHLTLEMWQASLDAAVAAQPSHISVYDLQVESGTPFARRYAPGASPLPPDDDAAAMYGCAVHTLTGAGYEHYEVSNYARPGHRSRHNQVYWSGGPYYGFGLGAASYQGGIRFSRPARMPAYTEWLDGMTAAGGEVLPGEDQPPQTLEDLLLDCIMLRLRTADGLDLEALAAQFGPHAAHTVLTALQPHMQSGLALTRAQPPVLVPAAAAPSSAPAAVAQPLADRALAVGARPLDGSHSNMGGGHLGLDGSMDSHAALPIVRLSDPEGFLLSNDIISDVFAAVSLSASSGQ